MQEKSCGVIVFAKDKVLLIKHNLGHIGFPKGHVEGMETEEETAIREVKEETNCDVEIIPGFREIITYSPKRNITKDVIFFIGKPLNKELSPQLAEVQKVDFVNYKEALNLLTYQDEKDLLKKALQYKNIYIKF